MRNIAIIISTLSSGGAERCASNLSIELSKMYNVILILFDGSEITYPYRGKMIDLKTPHSKNYFTKIFNIFKRTAAIRKIKKREGIDCAISLMDGANIVNVLSRRKERVITSVRIRLSSAKVGTLRKKMVHYVGIKSDRTIAVSEMVKKDLIGEFNIPENKIKTIYNSCDPELMQSLINKSVEPEFIDNDSHYIVTMGRLSEQKGQWHLIRVFKELVKQIDNIKLIIIGGGELEYKLKKLAIDLEIEEHIVFPGYIQNPHYIFQYCDMFVFPSNFEGLSNVLLEALAFGMPVIATDCPTGNREILAPNTDFNLVAEAMELCEYGILVPVMGKGNFNAIDGLTDKECELKKSILQLYKDQKLKTLYQQKATERIRDFSNEKIMKAWMDAIEMQ